MSQKQGTFFKYRAVSLEENYNLQRDGTAGFGKSTKQTDCCCFDMKSQIDRCALYSDDMILIDFFETVA